MNLLTKVTGWLARNLSNDRTASNSRVLQTVIVINLVVILWIVVAKSTPAWTLSDNVRLVMLTLITAGAGSYMVGKAAERE